MASASTIWRTWRREIVRGGVLFGLVVGAGFAVSQVRVSGDIPWHALDMLRGFDSEGDLFGAGRQVGARWEWRGPVTTSQHVWIRNTNGPVEVVAGTGDQLEVVTERSWRRSNPDDVEMVAVTTDRGVTICALWPARDTDCSDGGHYRVRDVRRNDVAVRFTVKLPRGVRLDASTVNGELTIDDAAAPVTAATVNGAVRIRSAAGPVKATTVNGSIDAALRALSGGDVELETVNGSIAVRLPERLNASLEAETVNGKVETEFPVQMTGKISPRRVRGTIGSGGITLRLTTVNGSVAIRQLRGGDGQRPGRGVRRTTRVEAPTAPVAPIQPPRP